MKQTEPGIDDEDEADGSCSHHLDAEACARAVVERNHGQGANGRNKLAAVVLATEPSVGLELQRLRPKLGMAAQHPRAVRHIGL